MERSRTYQAAGDRASSGFGQEVTLAIEKVLHLFEESWLVVKELRASTPVWNLVRHVKRWKEGKIV
jgi:hypothetical protein